MLPATLTSLFSIVLLQLITINNGEKPNPVEISSSHMDYDSKTILLREGKRVMVVCVFKGEMHHLSDLQWKNKAGKNIDQESSPSVFTVAMKEHGSGNNKNNLHFPSIHKRDEGVYECSGKNIDGEVFTDTVEIKVLDQVQWNDASSAVGGIVGEPLTIDCGVKKGSKEPQIEITNGDGEALDAEKFTIAGNNEVTIEHLSKEYNDMKISCVHVELVSRGSGEEFPVVDRKDVDIDVWFKPEFEDPEKDQYTIIDDKTKITARLHCNVSASNPAPHAYMFYRGSHELTDPKKYATFVNVGTHHGATLKIMNVDEDDLGEYRCEVNNGKAKNSQTIHLKESSPPPDPKVTLYAVKKHSLTWVVESKEKPSEGELPVNSISIQYIRKNILHDKDLDDDEHLMSDETWEKHATSVIRERNEKNEYEISGLRQGSEYIFKFRQISQAGAGDALMISGFTSEDLKEKEEMSASHIVFTLVSYLLPLTVLLL